MKICFIEVDTTREWACASIGPAFIAAYLREHRIHSEIMSLIDSNMPIEMVILLFLLKMGERAEEAVRPRKVFLPRSVVES